MAVRRKALSATVRKTLRAKAKCTAEVKVHGCRDRDQRLEWLNGLWLESIALCVVLENMTQT